MLHGRGIFSQNDALDDFRKMLAAFHIECAHPQGGCQRGKIATPTQSGVATEVLADAWLLSRLFPTCSYSYEVLLHAGREVLDHHVPKFSRVS